MSDVSSETAKPPSSLIEVRENKLTCRTSPLHSCRYSAHFLLPCKDLASLEPCSCSHAVQTTRQLQSHTTNYPAAKFKQEPNIVKLQYREAKLPLPVMSNYSGQRRERPQTKTPVACLPCRERKLKCSGGTPCVRCVLEETGDACCYVGKCCQVLFRFGFRYARPSRRTKL
jgi:hypothetical protein